MENMTPYEWAKHYWEHGLCIVPARNKRPIVDWLEYQDQRPDLDQLAAWFKGETFSRGLQLFAIAGRVSGFVVLDCDSAEAETMWRELLGDDLLDSTAALISGSGKGYHHYWFRLGDRPQESRAAHSGEMHWDLRSDGGGTVLPPSIHDTGNPYEWVRDLSHIQDWPYPEIPGKGINSVEGGGSSTGLAHLLTHPGEGGRNNWVTAVLGHYAKKLDFEDGYIAQAEMIWNIVIELPADSEYTREEFEATRTSVWNKEKRKIEQAGGDYPTADSGWLSSHGNRIYALCYDKDTSSDVMVAVSDFGIRAKEKVIAVNEETSYVVDVIKRDGEIIEYVLPGEYLGSNDRLSRWLASRDLVFHSNAKGDLGQRIQRVQRMQMLLVSQNPTVVESVQFMGHQVHPDHGDIYITNHGVIDADGPRELSIRPDATKHEYQQAWHYGFDGSMAEAMAVLREVMTFHDIVTTSVFGSMWALAPIKGAVMKATSLFPHMALVAPSESGKTNGFFNLMLQLNGRTASGGTFTAASLRDEMSVHRSGFVWIDDPSNTDDLGELLRSAAGEGSHARKGGQNWTRTINTQLVAPVVLSAEGMEMLRERAMMDRTIQVEATSPVGRQSIHDPIRTQWEDIALLMRTGSLSRYAGWYVQRSMMWLEQIGGVQGLADLVHRLRVGEGRQAEKMGILRAGAFCLEFVMGDAAPVPIKGYYDNTGETPIDVTGIVDAWAQGDSRESSRGAYITSVVIPDFLSSKGFVPSAKSIPTTPIWLARDYTLRVNIAGLASWWEGYASHKTNRDRARQLGSKSAMTSEVKAANWSTAPYHGTRYRVVPPEITKQILDELGMEPEWDEAELVAREDM